ncbi:3-methylornithine--L-lysine ligase PylC [Sporomusa acidovorans]|uniref:N5-carboxyaminoimidazole ribonucleotide synthase n=1 Tax=Sporomusa acidovorans (strain ATCC 49682 / DSM 3132 / Mol) TaxID=1123286 RepID=A0ABZ3J6W2_SPOA4|nr:3-methylornithine--L-lysine ligase PylC [Sporomusa acidovorans]OZC18526.1 D-alanine--D-alanine ligase [Sporomusa acidovorans DSM 3132]SDE37271.1 pyrrolysine biosynthesis protein PylC [Sporomusa acidovorans]
MRVVIVGGKLQGVEAAYLAKKAGWEVSVVDKTTEVPASIICDYFQIMDVTNSVEWLAFSERFDLVIPALENQKALESLVRCSNCSQVPLVFDAKSYSISSSKIISNEIFKRLSIPAPAPWPQCSFPIIIKPSGASGSEGVIKVDNAQMFECLKAEKIVSDMVIEEYLEGPSYSIEVIGYQGVYKALHITELHLDAQYDCKRVLGSTTLSKEQKTSFEQIALRLASFLNLNGVMDVEIILHKDQLKVLEIDARIPSQTPTAVYHATGKNMLEIIGKTFAQGRPWGDFVITEDRGVIYEHIHVNGENLEVLGEHILSSAGPLRLCTNFFGADEALTTYSQGKKEWVATLIIIGANMLEAWKKRERIISEIKRKCQIQNYCDYFP